MRIDVVTIFPEYFAPLDVSLLGKARAAGVLDVQVHDLREWTDDPHRSVDDAPYGGGPGMLMRPEPWGRALDAIAAEAPGPPRVLLLAASGRLMAQPDVERWAAESRLIVGCGRYEGIDARVVDDARRRMPVEEVSIGDYVLAGGEVAALVVIEAVARLQHGFMGNAASPVDESFSAGLLEAPAYTRPRSWRGLDVPEVLVSGDHAAIAAWRHEQAWARTLAQRPDLARAYRSSAPLWHSGGQPPT